MIDVKDVVRLRLPFPNTRSVLAKSAHMYICLKNGTNKSMVKCQTEKPTHLIASNPPFRYLSEDADINRNPFSQRSIIDCDKIFSIDNVEINASLLTTTRKDICDGLLGLIENELNYPELRSIGINSTDLVTLNEMVRQL